MSVTFAYPKVEKLVAEAAHPVPGQKGQLKLVEKTFEKAAEAIQSADPLGERVHEIENLKKPEALSRVAVLVEDVSRNYFELGGVLSRIRNDQWFDPFPTFDKWVEAETGFRRGKAYGLIRVYDALANIGLPFEAYRDIGWTKMAIIAKVLNNENAEHWIDKATTHSRVQLQEAVRQHLLSLAPAQPDEAGPTQRMTFAFFENQFSTVDAAIERAMSDGGTSKRSHALMLICLDFLAGLSLVQRLKDIGEEQAVRIMTEAFGNPGGDDEPDKDETSGDD